MNILSFFSPSKRPTAFLSIPHSGEIIPDEFRSYLKGGEQDWAQDVDAHVDQLIDKKMLGELGVAILVAHVHRITVDLNRARDHALFAWPLNTLGVPIIQGRPSSQDEEYLLGKYFDPYYEIIRSITGDLHHQFLQKRIVAIDLHSMPSAPSTYHLKQNPAQANKRADFCLSDSRGATCPPLFIQRAKYYLEAEGFDVAINDPYVGGHITQYLGTLPGLQNIQIEINRALYMDENNRQLLPHALTSFAPSLSNALSSLFQEFAP